MESKPIKKLTINDIADELGVSKTTISRAISGKGRMSTETRERVLKYIEEAEYKPNVMAKGLAQSKTYNIAIVFPRENRIMDSSFFQRCMFGVSEFAYTMDYDVLVSVVSSSNITQLVRIIENKKVDGVILTRTLVNDLPAEYLKNKGVPFVVIGTSLDGDILQVDHDHRGACNELISFILMKGIKRIGLIGGNENHIVTKSRYNGYLDAFKAYNKPVINDLVYTNVENSIHTGMIVEELLESKVECIACMDDEICAHVLSKLNKEKLKIPDDIKVASFYNSRFLEDNVPTITSLMFDPKELGMTACKILLDHMEGKEVSKRTLLKHEIVLKESTK